MFHIRIFCVVSLCLLAPRWGWANDQLMIGDFPADLDAHNLPAPWQVKEKTGRADFATVKADGLNALQLRSANTSFSLQREVNADLRQYPILSWKWKVTRLPEGGDFRRSKTDDQAAQLFVAFSKTKSIVYIWDTEAPENLMADGAAPPFMSIKVVVVRSGHKEMGKWISESRNVYEDYKRLYGDTSPAPVVRGMRIQINTQHTRTAAESYFADVMFRKS